MKYLINDLEPQALFHFFEEISAIPRPSLKEGLIADYLEAFAAAHGLFCYRDDAHNVLIKKPATADRVGEATVLLQAHTDMVTEKHPHIQHDFEREGLELRREGNCLFANGTTLGADDGFGVAVMLAVLADGTLSHPSLECLFTSAEEIGLVGATAFDYSLLTAKYMLNLDSAEEDTVIVGCCGGERADMVLPVQFEATSAAGIEISIGGLCGGHSGEDIHRNRLNSLVLMGKLLCALGAKTRFRLASLVGGDKTNAIPRDCTAVILADDPAAAKEFLAEASALLKGCVVAKEDEGLFVKTAEIPLSRVLDYADTDKVMTLLAIPNGVLKTREHPPIMPEYSRNFANARTCEDKLTFAFSSRSARDELIAASGAELNAMAKKIGATVSYYGKYPGWEGETDAPLVKAWQTAFEAVTGKTTAATLIHAGLETGLITGAVKGLEAIAVGCNIHDLHTPVETIELDSFARIYRTVIEFLRILK